MNGGPDATNGRLPSRLPWLSIALLLGVMPLIALVLDPNPHELGSEWRESARSTLAMLGFSLVNTLTLQAGCMLALRWVRPSRVVTGLLVCLAVTTVVTPLLALLPGWDVLDPRLFSARGVFALRALLLSLAWVSVAWLWAAVLEPRREAGLRAQVRALQSRLEPHFLFNALDTLSELVVTDAKAAETMLVRLSELLREVVVLAETPLVPLSRELALVREYLEVATLRFPSLQYELRGGETALVPPACLLPLVENAVLHGGGRVEVDVRREGAMLELTVANSPGPTRDGGTHTALKDLRERLRLLFDARASLTLEPTSDRYRVRLSIPLDAGR
jgi:hypothetical protein